MMIMVIIVVWWLGPVGLGWVWVDEVDPRPTDNSVLAHSLYSRELHGDGDDVTIPRYYRGYGVKLYDRHRGKLR